MHHYLPILLQIALVYLIALVSPGPNFFMITQLSLAGRRGLGAASALGVGTGSTIWASLAMLGFATVLQRIDWLYNGIRIAGAIYLVWFGIKLVRSSTKRGEAIVVNVETPPANDRGAHFRAWRTGMLTCLTKPEILRVLDQYLRDPVSGAPAAVVLRRGARDDRDDVGGLVRQRRADVRDGAHATRLSTPAPADRRRVRRAARRPGRQTRRRKLSAGAVSGEVFQLREKGQCCSAR